jgi:ribonuclease Z
MVKLVVLGSAHSVSDETHRHTHLAIVGEKNGLLLDCGVCPRSRLETMGIGNEAITNVVITHFHPDHVAGFPLYLMELWRTGRKRPMAVHAAPDCLGRIQSMLELYQWRTWDGMFPVVFSCIEAKDKSEVLACPEYLVTASSVRHFVPAIAIRVEVIDGMSVVYSSDTEPVEALVQLADRADLLFHEAAGEGTGHSGAAQAADVGKRAKVKRLVLIHYDPQDDMTTLQHTAQSVYRGEVILAKDGMEFTLKNP